MPIEYENLWLDQSNRPHPDGTYTTLTPLHTVTYAVVYNDTPTDPPPQYGSAQLEAEKPTPLPHAIMGPYTTTFPQNEGWHLDGAPDVSHLNRKPYKLSDLTIHNITKLLTKLLTKLTPPTMSPTIILYLFSYRSPSL